MSELNLAVLRARKGLSPTEVAMELTSIFIASPELYNAKIFTMESKFQNELIGKRSVSEKLRENFRLSSHELSPDAKIDIEQKGVRWSINDYDNHVTYIIKKEADELRVYCIPDISPASYRHWEKGRRKPKVENLCLLADFFETNIDFILKRTDDDKPKRRSLLRDIGVEKEDFWDVRYESTADERLCAKVFAWIASGRTVPQVLEMRRDQDWVQSKWRGKRSVEAILIHAVDDGVINISADKIPQDEDLASKLQGLFTPLEKVIVVESAGNKLLTKLLVGEAAALLFSNVVEKGSSVGISGGTTLARMVAALKKYPCQGLHLYPFENGLVPSSIGTCANTLIGQLKSSHPGENIRAYALQYSGFDYSKKPAQEKFPQHILREIEEIGYGFLGFGGLTREQDESWNDPTYREILAIARTSVDELIANGIVGDILFHSIKEDGKIPDDELNRRIRSIDPKLLIRKCRSGKPMVGVACGTSKGRSGSALLKAGYFNNIVIDSDLAKAIINASVSA